MKTPEISKPDDEDEDESEDEEDEDEDEDEDSDEDSDDDSDSENDIDLSNYFTKEEVENLLKEQIGKTEGTLKTFTETMNTTLEKLDKDTKASL